MAELAAQQVFAEPLPRQQGGAQAGFRQQGRQQVRHLQQAIAPALPAAIGGLQQLFEGLADVELAAGGGALVGAKLLQAIQQPITVQGQGVHPALELPIQPQGLQQVLHIQGAMAPAAGLVLGGEQQIPGVVAKPLGIAGEAGGRRCRGRRWRGLHLLAQLIWISCGRRAGSTPPCSHRDLPQRQ